MLLNDGGRGKRRRRVAGGKREATPFGPRSPCALLDPDGQEFRHHLRANQVAAEAHDAWFVHRAGNGIRRKGCPQLERRAADCRARPKQPVSRAAEVFGQLSVGPMRACGGGEAHDQEFRIGPGRETTKITEGVGERLEQGWPRKGGRLGPLIRLRRHIVHDGRSQIEILSGGRCGGAENDRDAEERCEEIPTVGFCHLSLVFSDVSIAPCLVGDALQGVPISVPSPAKP